MIEDLGFLDWSEVLKITLIDEDDVSLFLQSFKDCCKEIEENQKLSPPNEEFTSTFLYDTCPFIVNTILNFSCVSEELKNTAKEFINALCPLSDEKYASVNSEIDFSKIYNPQQPFYVANNIDPPKFKFNLDEVKSVEDFIPIFATFKAKNIEEVTTSEDSKIAEKFVEILEKTDPKDLKIKSLADEIYKFSNTYYNNFDVMKRCLIIFSNLLKNSEKAEEQVIFADCFGIILNDQIVFSNDKSLIEKLKDIKFNEILAKDLHYSALQKLIHFTKYFIDYKTLKSFFIKMVHAHAVYNDAVVKIVSCSLPALAEDEIIDLIHTISSFDPPTQISFDCLLKILGKCETEKTRKETFLSIIKIGLKNNLIDKVIDSFDKYDQWNITEGKIEAALFLSEKLNISGACKALKQIIKNSDSELDEILPEIKQSILSKLSEEGCDRESLFKLLAEIISEVFDTESLKEIINLGMDKFFYTFIIKQIKRKKVSEDGLIYLLNTIEESGLSNLTYDEASCLVECIYIININKGNIKEKMGASKTVSRFRSFTVCKFPIFGIKTLFNVYCSTENAEIETMVKKFIIKTYSKIKREYIIKITEQFFKMIESVPFSRRSLDMIYSYLIAYSNTYPIENFGYFSHDPAEKLNCPIAVQVPGEELLKFNVSYSTTIKEICKYVARKMEIGIKFHLELNNKSLGELDKWSFYQYNNSQVDLVFDCDSDSEEDYSEEDIDENESPCIYMHNKGLQRKLFDIESDDKELYKSAWNILKILPNDTSIEEIVTKSDELIKFLTTKNEYFVRYALDIYNENGNEILPLYFLYSLITPDRKKYTKILISIIKDSSAIYNFVPIYECIHNIICLAVKADYYNGRVFTDLIQIVIDAAKYKGKEFKLAKEDALEVINNTDDYIFNSICYILEYTDQDYIVDICFNGIINNAHKKRYNDVIKKVVLKVITEKELESISKKCFSLISEGNDCFASILVSLLNKCDNIHVFDEYLPIIAKKAFHPTKHSKQFLKCLILFFDGTIKPDDSVTEVIREALSFKTDIYNYNKENFAQSDTGYAGLRNLGATCYMNSVLQQLFFSVQFRNAFLGMKPRNDGDSSLQEIFRNMLQTKAKCVDTEKFCKTWLGWDKKPVNVTEQQDACLFLQLLLDQMPKEVSESFKGVIINKIECEDGFSTENREDFFTIPLAVQNMKNISESIKSYIQSESLVYKNNSNEDVQAVKYSRIEKLPDILIIQLKRFEYDIITYRRKKINTKFEFPDKLDVKDLCDTKIKSENTMYNLKGAIIHSGYVDGGHYISAIKQDGEYLLFDDRDVSNITETEFNNKTFGSSSYYETNDQSAFVLFYKKEGLIEDSKSIVKDEEIEEENKNIEIVKYMFSSGILKFILEYDDYEAFLNYFFNIFAHFQEDVVKDCVDAVTERIYKSENIDATVDYLIEHHDLVKETLSRTTNEIILDVLITFLYTSRLSIEKEKMDSINEIFTELITEMGRADNWRKANSFARVIFNYIYALGEEKTSKYDACLSDFLNTIYTKERSSASKEFINISNIIRLLMYSTVEVSPEQMKQLKIGNHKEAFEEYVEKLYNDGKISLEKAIEYVKSEKIITDLLKKMDQEEEPDVLSFLKIIEKNYTLLISALHNYLPINLMNRYPTEFIINLLTFKYDVKVRDEGEYLAIKLSNNNREGINNMRTCVSSFLIQIAEEGIQEYIINREFVLYQLFNFVMYVFSFGKPSEDLFPYVHAIIKELLNNKDVDPYSMLLFISITSNFDEFDTMDVIEDIYSTIVKYLSYANDTYLTQVIDTLTFIFRNRKCYNWLERDEIKEMHKGIENFRTKNELIKLDNYLQSIFSFDTEEAVKYCVNLVYTIMDYSIFCFFVCSIFYEKTDLFDANLVSGLASNALLVFPSDTEVTNSVFNNALLVLEKCNELKCPVSIENVCKSYAKCPNDKTKEKCLNLINNLIKSGCDIYTNIFRVLNYDQIFDLIQSKIESLNNTNDSIDFIKKLQESTSTKNYLPYDKVYEYLNALCIEDYDKAAELFITADVKTDEEEKFFYKVLPCIRDPLEIVYNLIDQIENLMHRFIVSPIVKKLIMVLEVFPDQINLVEAIPIKVGSQYWNMYKNYSEFIEEHYPQYVEEEKQKLSEQSAEEKESTDDDDGK